MGIPIQTLVETKGEVNVPDCVGCGRCITNCPEKVLSFSDVRNLFKRTPSSVEHGRPRDVNLRGKEFNVVTSSTHKLENSKPSVIEPAKDEMRNSSIEANQRTCDLSNLNLNSEKNKLEIKKAS